MTVQISKACAIVINSSKRSKLSFGSVIPQITVSSVPTKTPLGRRPPPANRKTESHGLCLCVSMCRVPFVCAMMSKRMQANPRFFMILLHTKMRQKTRCMVESCRICRINVQSFKPRSANFSPQSPCSRHQRHLPLCRFSNGIQHCCIAAQLDQSPCRDCKALWRKPSTPKHNTCVTCCCQYKFVAKASCCIYNFPALYSNSLRKIMQTYANNELRAFQVGHNHLCKLYTISGLQRCEAPHHVAQLQPW